jgi:hypothetical protein
MVKPTGSICNLDCTYCYYLHKKELLGSTNKFRISDEILETHIRQYIEGQDRSEVVFSCQGGEPTLLGIEFFQKVIALEQKYKKPGQLIENDLQTNGTLLNDDCGAFLKKHNFLVGLSIDGPKELHDRYRVAKDGAPTLTKVFAAAEMLHRHDVPFNSLDRRQSRKRQTAVRGVQVPAQRSSAAANAVHSVRRAESIPGYGTSEVGSRQFAAAGLVGRPAWYSGLGGHGLVGRSGELGRFSFQGLGLLVPARHRQGFRQPL